MIEVFLKSLLIGYSGAVMPGSLLTYTLDKSMKAGAKAGFLISVGHALLELVLVILIFLGAGKYLGTTAAQTVIGILGGLVLIFFGVGMVTDIVKGRISIDFNKPADGKYGNIIVGGALISASNPYFIIWWAAVGLGLIMNAYNSLGIPGIVLFYFGHILADFTWYCFISALISKARTFINLKVYRAVIILLGICLVGFGLSFLIASIKLAYNYLA
ncbi:MAG TPA: LysE family transporter [Clostridia bacterium]|nr:LysE family transporter [Clostridia bacterium]